MPIGEDAQIVAVVAIILLIFSGFWAERRFASFAQLPMQYGFSGRPSKMGSRGLAIWLPTGIFVTMAMLNLGLLKFADPSIINGDPEFGLMVTTSLLVGAQALILWLHTRWARSQS